MEEIVFHTAQNLINWPTFIAASILSLIRTIIAAIASSGSVIKQKLLYLVPLSAHELVGQ